jgi:hypothetical protein
LALGGGEASAIIIHRPMIRNSAGPPAKGSQRLSTESLKSVNEALIKQAGQVRVYMTSGDYKVPFLLIGALASLHAPLLSPFCACFGAGQRALDAFLCLLSIRWFLSVSLTPSGRKEGEFWSGWVDHVECVSA